jgi:hypothetical protein
LGGGFTGRLGILTNIGSFNITLKDEDASGTAANRFALNGDLTLSPDESVFLFYDGTSSRWRTLKYGVSGGGITNAAAANEMMKSDGTNAVASDIFSTSAGVLVLGSSSGARSISTGGTNSPLTISSAGTGGLGFGPNGTVSVGFTYASNVVTLLSQSPATRFDITGSNQVSSGDGGDVILKGGQAGQSSGNGDGGDVTVQSGQRRAAGSGVDGNVILDPLTGYLIMENIPTSAAGLPSGAVWSNLGILTIV